WFQSDFNGRIAVQGQAVAGLDPARLGILGNVEIDGTMGANAAIVSGGLIGGAAGGAAPRGGGVAGILAAQGAISYGAGADLSGASIFEQAQGVNAAAIAAIFTDMGQQLFIDATPQGLHNLALILTDLAALHVGSDGNLTGPIP